jgi:hypothetical protein
MSSPHVKKPVSTQEQARQHLLMVLRQKNTTKRNAEAVAYENMADGRMELQEVWRAVYMCEHGRRKRQRYM